jgi:hypothetical protein
MPDPEVTPHERNLREVFWSGRELAVHVARLSVLFEDLRLESTVARYTEPLPQVDTTSKNYRYAARPMSHSTVDLRVRWLSLTVGLVTAWRSR